MYPGLVSCPFYAIPIYPFKFMKFFIYLLYYYYSMLIGCTVNGSDYSRASYINTIMVRQLLKY